MPVTSPLTESLELVSDREGDVTGAVYDRLFASFPELEALFAMDTDGGVRGSMLSQAFECLMDLSEGSGVMAETVIRSERVNHDSYDVPEGMFEVFFGIIRDVVKEVAGSDWSPLMEAAWASALEDATRLSQPLPA